MPDSYLKELEAESIYILRETVASFKNPVLLYSVGKDSSVSVRLAIKAFYPGKMPFPLMHIDTGYKFPEMYKFRDEFCRRNNLRLIVERNEQWIKKGAHPSALGTDKCCRHLKTQALLDALRKHNFDAAIGGARREEEKSRAKERVFSLRDKFGQWDPKNQRPELWDLYNTFINEGETVRVFPLSNWTELDIWKYIRLENIPVVPLYFAKERTVVANSGVLVPSEKGQMRMCRFRSLGCVPCTGAIESGADNLDKIIEELAHTNKSERENRIIDLSSDSSMEEKKRSGYF
jgi:sulfate adenylyltransferase subunit 2